MKSSLLYHIQTYDSGIDINLGEKSPGDSSEDIEHRKVKSLKQVDVVAWIILLTISIECFIGKCVETIAAKPLKLGYRVESELILLNYSDTSK